MKKSHSPSTIALKGGVFPCQNAVKIFISAKMVGGKDAISKGIPAAKQAMDTYMQGLILK